MPDIFLYAGEPSLNDVRLSDPTVLRSGGGPTIIETDANSSGSATCTGTAAALWNSLGSSDGSATVTGLSSAIYGSVGSSAGLATVTGLSAGIWASTGACAGLAITSGISGAIWPVVGSSNGVAVCLAEGETIFTGPPPAGTVSVRYLVGQTANVVPVVTVGVWAIGVVSVREFVGPANVVPVREVTIETPHVKVVKVSATIDGWMVSKEGTAEAMIPKNNTGK